MQSLTSQENYIVISMETFSMKKGGRSFPNDPVSPLNCTACKYVGSFLVSGAQEATKTEFVRKRLIELRESTFSRNVLLVTSLAGIKVCSSDGKQVHMAHAMKRVSYATCDSDNRQFAFLAREPRRNIYGQQFCHVFKTETTDEAEEINSIIGRALRDAYLHRIKQERISSELKLTNNNYKKRELAPLDTMPHTVVNEPEETSLPSEEIEKRVANAALLELQRSSAEILLETEIEGDTSRNLDRMPQTPKRQEKETAPATPTTEGRLEKVLEELRSPSPRLFAAGENFDQLRRADSDFSPMMPRSGASSRKERPLSMFAPNSTGKHDETNDWLEDRKERVAAVSASDLARSSCDLSGIEKRKTGGIMRRLFGGKRHKSHSPPLVVDPNQSMSASDSLSVRCSSKGKKRRPMSEIFSDAFRGLGLNNSNRTASVCVVPVSKKDQSPRLSVKSLNASVGKSRGRKGQAMEDEMRRSANLEHLYRAKGNSCLTPETRSVSMGMNRMRLKYSPGGTGCGRGCQFIGVSPEIAQKSTEFLLPMDYQDEMALEDMCWFHPEANRETVVKVLKDSEVGAFVVRRSASQKCCLAISVRVPVKHNLQKVSHYLILKTSRGFKLKGFTKVFPAIQNLVTHHSIMPELLPCRLKFTKWEPSAFISHAQNNNAENYVGYCDSEEIYGNPAEVF